MTKEKTQLTEKSYILEDGPMTQSPTTPQSDASSNDLRHLIRSAQKEFESSTLPNASFNYINSIIGSGVIGMPYALQQAGFGFGLLLLIFVAVLTDYSLILMVRSGHLAGIFSYQGIMESAYGRGGYMLLSSLQFIYPFIAMVSYNVVVGDTLTKVFLRVFQLEQTSWFAQREIVVGLATLGVTLPLCLQKDISKLSKVSLFSLICVGFILLCVIAKFFLLYDLVPKSPDAWSFINWNITPAVGIMAFAFMCHHNTFLIYGSIQEADQRRWDKVTHISLFASFMISALFGVAGYGTFTGYSQGDLLENYCGNDDLMNMARLLFSVTILLTYPIECFVCRDVLDQTVLRNVNETPEVINNKHVIVTVSIVVITYLISMSTDCLGVVLELNGVLAAVPLAYVLPALCYIRLEPSPVFSKEKAPAFVLVFFGVIVAILGLVFVASDSGDIATCSHGKVMDYCQNFTLEH